MGLARPKGCANPGMSRKPHDELTQRAFSNLAVVGGYLSSALPSELAARLILARLKPLKSRSTGPAGHERVADFVYEVPFAGPGSLLLCVLIEHQSRVDPLMAARLYVYTARALEAWCRAHPRERRVPAVLPLVLYNGRAPWTASRSLQGLNQLPPDLTDEGRAFLPQLRYGLDDLRRHTDLALRQRPLPPLGTVTLLLLRHGRDSREDFLAFLRLHGDAFNALGNRDDWYTAICYIYNTSEASSEEVLEILVPQLEASAREVAVTAAEQLHEQGRKKGREEGREEGRAEGARQFFLRLVRSRFVVTDEVEQRVRQASTAELLAWGERVLGATSLEDVFAG